MGGSSERALHFNSNSISQNNVLSIKEAGPLRKNNKLVFLWAARSLRRGGMEEFD